MRTPFDIDWGMVVARLLLIKQLQMRDIQELHEMESTRAKRYYGEYEHFKQKDAYYPNWLIHPFEIEMIFRGRCRIVNPTSQEKGVIIDIITRNMPTIEPEGMSHSSSVKWQAEWDVNIYQNVPTLEAVGSKRKSDLVDRVYGGEKQ